MIMLVDTGVLLRAFDRSAAEHQTILQAIRRALNRGDKLAVTVQNIAGFWNVSTRPREKNGFDLSAGSVARRLLVIERFCKVLPESTASFHEWKGLVNNYRVLGVKVHDARLVSVMMAANIGMILTLNKRDFQRYAEISAVTPEEIVKP